MREEIQRAIPWIAKPLKDKDKDVRQSAVKKVFDLTEGISEIVKYLNAGYKDARWAAVRALLVPDLEEKRAYYRHPVFSNI